MSDDTPALLLRLGRWTQRHALTEPITVGRSTECEIVVPDGRLSRRHFRVAQDDLGVWLLEDLGSRLGTTLNGVYASGPLPLAIGDRIIAGPLVAELITAAQTTVITGDLSRDDHVVKSLLAAIDDLYGAEELPELLRRIVDNALLLTGLERGACLVVDNASRFEATVARSLQGDELPPDQLLTRTLPREAIETRKTVLGTPERLLENDPEASAMLQNLRTIVCVPCLDQQRVVAVLYLDSTQARSVGPAEQSMLEVLAGHGGLAIARAELRAKEALAQRRERYELEKENAKLRARVAVPPPMGTSAAFVDVLQTVKQLASSELTICLTGETGTGKEVVARYAHSLSPRASEPFVAVDCGAIPEGLIESELFGHVRGSFTGATTDRLGRFREANGGTVFLDEIAELPVELQSRLLRVLQERTVQPVGATGREPIDVRVICATHQNLDEAVRRGTFRRDLYYRVAVVGAHLPALRDRGTDILLLAEAFLEDVCKQAGRTFEGFSREAVQTMLEHPWEGNVRELRHRVHRAAVLGRGPWVRRSDLGLGDDAAPIEPGSSVEVDDTGPLLPLKDARTFANEQFERTYIRRLLQETGGNVSNAARLAEVSRQAIQQMLKRLDIDSSEFRDE